MPELRAGHRTDTGRVRVVNQDNYIAVRSLFAVADGMGGHAGGEVASRIAVEAVGSASLTTVRDLIEAVQVANAEIYHQSVTVTELHGMGTTFCGLALLRDVDHEEMVVVNVGDSRVYVLQDGKLLQITRDHSFVEDLVAAGEITHEEARHHPRRHIVTRVLGIEPDVQVDTWEVTPFVGDRYLLCSDGLTGEIDDDEIASVLRTIPDPQGCADELLERALVSGARDNVTVLIVDVVADDPLVVAHLEPELGGWLSNGHDSAPVPFAPPPVAGEVPTGALASGDVAAGADASGDGVAAGAVTIDPPVGDWLGDEQPFAATDDDQSGQPVRVVVGDPDRPLRRRSLTWRTFAFVGLLAITAAVGFSAIALYARAGYTVTAIGEDVVVQKGRPGGLLWFDPTLEEDTAHTLTQFPEADRERIVSGRHFGSLEEARTYVARKVAEKVEQDSPSGPTTTVAGTSATVVAATTLPTTAPTIGPVAGSATTVAPAAITATTVVAGATAASPTTVASVP